MPPGSAALPTFRASARVWFHPMDPYIPAQRNNRYSGTTMLGYHLELILPQALIMPLRYQVPETVFVPKPPPTDFVMLHTLPVLHPLAAGRWPDHDSRGQAIYLWEMVAEGGPAGRAGSVFVPDPARDRLVLTVGETAEGPALDAWIYDRPSQTWARRDLQVPGLSASSHPGHAVADGKLYLYGGRNGDTLLEGLYEIDLGTLAGERIDTVSGPGPRAAAALRYHPGTRMIYLYGGRGSQGNTGDLWAFDLDTRTWSLLSPEGTAGGPPPMQAAAIAVCPISGAISVLSGQVEGGSAPEPLWRFSLGTWRPYSQIIEGSP